MPTHTIVAGDTFWRLSQQYGCTLDEILAVNPGVIPAQLQIGQIVQLPSSGSQRPPGSTSSTHIIVSGDTFWRLSQVYGCTLEEILAANPGVVPEQLQIGQIVRIPYQSTQTHTIIAGDTFWRLSQQYGCTLDEILAVNPGVIPEQLQIGQVVRLPNNASGSQRPPGSTILTHIIVAGDTFWRLSQQYGCTLDEILAVNPGVIPEQLQIGQIVRVPSYS